MCLVRSLKCKVSQPWLHIALCVCVLMQLIIQVRYFVDTYIGDNVCNLIQCKVILYITRLTIALHLNRYVFVTRYIL